MGPSTAFATLSTRAGLALALELRMRRAAREQVLLDLVITPGGIQRFHERGASAHVWRADGGADQHAVSAAAPVRHAREPGRGQMRGLERARSSAAETFRRSTAR